jgi:hypothetical protein
MSTSPDKSSGFRIWTVILPGSDARQILIRASLDTDPLDAVASFLNHIGFTEEEIGPMLDQTLVIRRKDSK